MVLIVLFICVLFTLILCASLLMGVFTVPFVPTPKRVFLTLLPYNLIKNGDEVYELGCGNALFLRFFANKFLIQAKGCEIIPLFYLYGCIFEIFHNFTTKKSKIKIEYQSFFTTDLSQVDVVYCYLLPKYLNALTKNFDMMKSGSLIISYDFKIQKYQLFKEISIKQNHTIYLYKR